MVAAVATVGGLIAATPASAHRFPAGCLTNGITLTMDKNQQIVRPGDLITYRMFVDNRTGTPCQVDAATMNFYPPTAAGLSSATPIVVAASQVYMGGFPQTLISSRPHTVTVNPGVQNLIAESGVRGVLHDVPGDTSFAEIKKTLGTQVTQPKITLDKIGSIQAGLAPQNVTYTFLVRNESSTPVAMNRVAVTDDKCGGPTFVGGDDGDGLLENGETWTYTCSMLHQAPGVYTNTASVCAYSTVPDDTTRPVCSPPDTWTVTLTPPPAAPPAVPQVAVKPTTAAQAPCTLSTPKGLRVRAGQLNTIRVRVRNVDAGSTVTLTLPGTKKKYTAKTNSSGIATLRVRPTKSGRARLSVAECSEVENLQVRPARRVTAQRNPRVTG